MLKHLLIFTTFFFAGTVTAQTPDIEILGVRDGGPLVPFISDIQAATPGFDLFRAGSYEAAIAELKPLADAGNAAAQNAMGAFLTETAGPLAPFYDLDEGIRYYTAAANQGYARAFFNLGILYGETHSNIAPNDTLAFDWFQRAVDVDYRESFYNYARALANGTGTPADTTLARDYAERALETSERAAALTLLGDLAYYGEGETVDLAKSLELFEQSAAEGDAYGALSAGFQYYFGEGVETDDTQARIYFEQAIAGGEYRAAGYLAEIYAEGFGVPVDGGRAIEIAREGDAAGDGYASAFLGYLLAGTGDYGGAQEAYRRAADRGEQEGLYQLGDLAYFGLGEPQDYEKAFGLFEATIAEYPLHSDALYSIGYMKMRGEGTPVDLAGAVNFIDRALAEGNWSANIEVPVLFAHPDYDGPHADQVRAMAWCLYLTANDFDFSGPNADETNFVCQMLPSQLDASDMDAAQRRADSL